MTGRGNICLPAAAQLWTGDVTFLFPNKKVIKEIVIGKAWLLRLRIVYQNAFFFCTILLFSREAGGIWCGRLSEE
jgi:hypothetical protein